jgi:hypothetical protein
MRGQDVVFFMFVLILIYLLVINWKGANALVVSGGNFMTSMVKSLQGR